MPVHTASRSIGRLTQDQFDVAARELSLGRDIKIVESEIGLSYSTARRIQTGELQRPEDPEGYLPPPKERDGGSGFYNQTVRTPPGHLPQTPAAPEEPEEVDDQ